MIYLLGTLLDGVEKVHCQPEAVHHKGGKEPGIIHSNWSDYAPMVSGHGFHLMFTMLSTNKVVTKSHLHYLAKLAGYTWNG